MATEKQENENAGLKRSLYFSGVLGQSVASIGLTASVALNIPDIYGTAGLGTWLTYLIATVAIVLVALNINQFAGSFSSSRGLAVFVENAFGEWGGLMTAWSLVLAYVIVSMCVLAGFAESASVLFHDMGITLSPPIYYVVCVIACVVLACWEVHFSSLLMLITEAVSVAVVTILCFVVLSRHNFVMDMSQFSLHGATQHGIRQGLVLAVLSFTAFESATTLGQEVHDPLKTIPRAVLAGPIIAGIFFIFAAYVMAFAFHTLPPGIATSSDPLEMLAQSLGLKDFAIWLAFGATVCFFGAMLANITAAGRMVYSLAQMKLLPARFARVHPRSHTPYLALRMVGGVSMFSCLIMALFHCEPMDIFNYTGTIATYGFLLVYFLVSIGAPVYLRRQGLLTTKSVMISLLAAFFILLVTIGNIYPIPTAPTCYLPLVFLFLLIAGGIWFAFKRRKVRN